MDTSKQPQTSTNDESSDDLIAELARLVGQEARSDSSGARPQRTEPRVEPEHRTDAAEPPVEPEHAAQTVPQHRDDVQPQQADDAMPVFDFGFGTAGKVAEAERVEQPSAAAEPEHDPIADLIAGAEAERFAADDHPGEPEPVAPPEFTDRRDPEPAPAPFEPAREAAAKPADRDPLSEIEALIGEAARVSAAGASGRRVRSTFLPEDQDPQAIERAVDTAEDSIRTATEARSGAPEARKEPEMPDLGAAEFAPAREPGPVDDDDGPVAGDAFVHEAPRPRRRRAGTLIPVLAGAGIFLLIGGAYFMFFGAQPDTGEPPVLTADAGPLKEEPEATQTASAASESVVFNEISGTSSTEGETLVSRDETGGVTGAAISNVLNAEEGTGELVNRSVRTVTVRPDGTIVSSDEGVAGGSVLPVDRPDVPTISNDATGDDPIGDAIVAAIGDDAATRGGAGTSAPDATPEGEAGTAEAGANGGDDATAGSSANPDAPEPVARPEGLVASNGVTPSLNETPVSGGSSQTVAALGNTQAETAAQAPATPASGAPESAGGAPAAWVQLASQRDEEVARAGVGELQSRYGALFNGAEPEVSRVDLGERGIYYRVRLPQPSIADANSVCDAIKGQGGDCFVLNN